MNRPAIRLLPLILASLTLAWLSGCATRRPTKQLPAYSAPSTAAVRQQIGTATSSLTKAQVSVGKAQGSLKAAQDTVQTLIAGTPDDPQLIGLQFRLSEAQEQMTEINARHLEALNALEEAEKERDTLQTEVSAQTTTLNATVRDKNTALDAVSALSAKVATVTEEKRKLTVSLWKWRLGVAGFLLLLALFVLRKPLARMVGIPML